MGATRTVTSTLKVRDVSASCSVEVLRVEQAADSTRHGTRRCTGTAGHNPMDRARTDADAGDTGAYPLSTAHAGCGTENASVTA